MSSEEPCTIHDLPTQLIHRVCRNLSVTSQQRLFLSSAQLYKLWHLHIPETDDKWLCLDWGMHMLARFSSESCQLVKGRIKIGMVGTSLEGSTYTLLHITVNAKSTASESYYDMRISRSGIYGYPPVQLTLRKDQVRQRLAHAPDNWTPEVFFTSQASLSQQDFACAAQQLFSLLCLRWQQGGRHGNLRFRAQPVEANDEDHFWPERPADAITVMVSHYAHLNCSCWTYEGKCCKGPPELPFDRLAIKYTKVELFVPANKG